MKKILVVSDTHSYPLPPEVIDIIPKVDVIAHCGDFSDYTVWQEFSQHACFHAVLGNTDDRILQDKLPLQHIFQCEDVSIGMTHGTGSPPQVPDRVEDLFDNVDVDIVCFGHSHFPLIEQRDQFTLFNPGSPTDMVRAPYRSYGLITVNGSDFKIKHVKIKETYG